MEASLCQGGPKGPHPVEGPGLDRAQGQTEPLGDLGLGEALFMGQADHLGMTAGIRQSRELRL
jgi:hypothetical protein